MKKKFTIIAALLITSICLFSQGNVKNVLFIGNSYTSANNLPELIKSISQSMGDNITYDRNLPGGCTFSLHCSNNSINLIRQGGWDIVVLQEQSQYPSFPIAQVERDVFPYAQTLVNAVYESGECSEPMFYMTWGRKNGDSMNAYNFPILATYEGMDSMLYERYMYMKTENDASVSPVGRVWRYIRTNYPEIELYTSDESHPSMAGSYAAACAFYTMFFHRNPINISYIPNNISTQTANKIKNATKIVVFDNIGFWQRPLPVADFTYSILNNQVTFNNMSMEAESYTWDFGDGTFSNEIESAHTYPNGNRYEVSLVASRHCISDTITKIITLNTASLYPNKEKQCKIFPNPAKNFIEITFPENAQIRKVEIYDVFGRKIYQQNYNDKSEIFIKLDFIPPGMYLVETYSSNNTWINKLLKSE